MKSFFADNIKSHFNKRYDVLDAFEHRYDTFDMTLNCTVFIEHRGIAISGTTSFFEGQMISYDQVIEDIERDIRQKMEIWDFLRSAESEFEKLGENDKRSLVWMIREIAFSLDTLGITHIPWNGGNFEESAETLSRIYGYNLKRAENTYKSVLKTLAMGNDDLIELLRGGYELPEEYRI